MAFCPDTKSAPCKQQAKDDEIICPHLLSATESMQLKSHELPFQNPPPKPPAVNVSHWGNARWGPFRVGGDKMYDELILFLKPFDVQLDHVAEWKKVQKMIDESKVGGMSSKSIDRLVFSNLFSVIGLRGLQSISKNFYERVWNDEDWFRGQFVEANPIEEEIVNQWTFFVQFLGGPKVFEMWRSRLGEDAMLLKHSLFEMTSTLMARWLLHMDYATQSALGGNLYLEAPDAIDYFMRYCKSFTGRLLS